MLALKINTYYHTCKYWYYEITFKMYKCIEMFWQIARIEICSIVKRQSKRFWGQSWWLANQEQPLPKSILHNYSRTSIARTRRVCLNVFELLAVRILRIHVTFMSRCLCIINFVTSFCKSLRRKCNIIKQGRNFTPSNINIFISRYSNNDRMWRNIDHC